MADTHTPDIYTHSFRVRYAECDLQSVVFNSRYLEYADLLITEYFRDRGIGFSGENSLEFHVARAVVDFRKPILVDEVIEGHVWCERIGNSSMTTGIKLLGANSAGSSGGGEDDLRADIELVHVHVDLESGQALPIPAHARAALLGENADG